jgi:hypothetical protein
MNGLLQTTRGLTVTALPVEFEALTPPPLLLPGESLEHYKALRQAIFADLAPDRRSNGCSPSTSPNCRGRSNAIACCAINFLRPIAKRQLRPRFAAST